MGEKRTLSARELMADFRAGADDEFLMTKYDLSENGLESVFQKLIAAGLLTRAELDRRRLGEPDTEEVEIIEDLPRPAVPNWNPVTKESLERLSERAPKTATPSQSIFKCPACGLPQSYAFKMCPQCGIIVEKYLQGQETQDGSDVGQAARTKRSPWYGRSHVVILLCLCPFLLGGLILVMNLAFKGGRQPQQKVLSVRESKKEARLIANGNANSGEVPTEESLAKKARPAAESPDDALPPEVPFPVQFAERESLDTLPAFRKLVHYHVISGQPLDRKFNKSMIALLSTEYSCCQKCDSEGRDPCIGFLNERIRCVIQYKLNEELRRMGHRGCLPSRARNRDETITGMSGSGCMEYVIFDLLDVVAAAVDEAIPLRERYLADVEQRNKRVLEIQAAKAEAERRMNEIQAAKAEAERRMKETQVEQKQKLSAAGKPISEITWYDVRGKFIDTRSDLTNAQRTREWASNYKRKWVRWTGRVTDVKESWGGGITLNVNMLTASLTGMDLTFSVKKDQHGKALKLKKNDMITFVGRMESEPGSILPMSLEDVILEE